MELYQIRYFLCAAKYQNISRAAEELLVAQPSVSRAIAILEAELGMPLFQRVGKRIELNEAGRLAHARFVEWLEGLDAIQAALRQYAETGAQHIRLGMYAASRQLPALLEGFRLTHPAADIEVSLQPGEACDLSIASVNGDGAGAGSLLLREEIALAVPLHSPLAQQASIAVGQLVGQPCILTQSGALRELVDGYLAAHGVQPTLAYTCDYPAMARELVSAGLGFTFWPVHTWGQPAGGRVKLCRIQGGGPQRQLYLSVQPGASPAVQGFAAYTTQFFAQLAGQGQQEFPFPEE